MNNIKINKLDKLLIMLVSIVIVFVSKSFVFAEDFYKGCEDGACAPRPLSGDYCCEPVGDYDDDGSTDYAMVCTGGGCPSWMCTDATCTPVKTGSGYTCCGSETFLVLNGAVCEDRCYNILGGDALAYKAPTCYCYICEKYFCGISFLGGGTCDWCYDIIEEDTCDNAPTAPILNSPANGAVLEDTAGVTFSWSPPTSWGDSTCSTKIFQLQVDNDAGFLAPIVYDGANLPSTTLSYSLSLAFPGTYYWRVRAANEAGSTWSEVRSFTLTFLPPYAVMNPNTSIIIPVGNGYAFTADARDASTIAGHKLNEIKLRLRNRATGLWSDLTTGSAGSILCGDTNTCWIGDAFNTPTAYREWYPDPSQEGWWDLVVSVTSTDITTYPNSAIARCSGNPDLLPTWPYTDCDSNGNDDLEIFVRNPPIAAMTAPAEGETFYAMLSGTLPHLFTVNARDTGGNIRTTNSVEFMKRQINADGSYGPEQFLTAGSVVNCSNTSDCTVSFSYTPTIAEGGTWVAYMNAYDAYADNGGKCTGNPEIPVGFSDCGRTGLVDHVTFTVDSCQEYPSAPFDLLPRDSEQFEFKDVLDSAFSLTWQHGAWGETCGPPNHTYTVYGYQVNRSEDCPDRTTHTYAPMTNCIAISGDDDDDIDTVECNSNWYRVAGNRTCWYVEANNGELSTLSDIADFEILPPILSENWITAGNGGSIYAGYIEQDIPNVTTTTYGWDEPFSAYSTDALDPANSSSTAVITSGDILVDIKDDSIDPDEYTQSNLWSQGANFDISVVWPNINTYDGIPPTGDKVISLSGGEDCTDLFKGSEDPVKLSGENTYVLPLTCVNQALEGIKGDNFSMASEGTVVIYVTSDVAGELVFGYPFVTNNVNYNIIFITDSKITVKMNIPDSSLTDSDILENATNPNLADIDEDKFSYIMASFIVPGTYQVVGVPTEDSLDDPDLTFIADGPIITKNIRLERNRGLFNSEYPSEIFKYNHKYLYALTSDERISDSPNITGLFTVDLSWIEN